MTFLELLADIRHNIDKIFISQEYENVNFSVEVSKPGFGDITCNAAFLLAKSLKRSPHDIAKTIAVFSAFTEGLKLFATFAILLNFPRQNKMKGMGQIVTWSVRDETLHCNSMIKLFRTFVDENPDVWTDKLKKEI